MSIKSAIAKIWARKRAKTIYRLQQAPARSQQETLQITQDRLTSNMKNLEIAPAELAREASTQAGLAKELSQAKDKAEAAPLAKS